VTSWINIGSASFCGADIYANCLFLFAIQVVQKALDDAKLSESDLSAVAVTIGPGLSLCLRGMFF
jgi:tRNA A37 threonylcarbamoyltransferase TsaD